MGRNNGSKGGSVAGSTVDVNEVATRSGTVPVPVTVVAMSSADAMSGAGRQDSPATRSKKMSRTCAAGM